MNHCFVHQRSKCGVRADQRCNSNLVVVAVGVCFVDGAIVHVVV